MPKTKSSKKSAKQSALLKRSISLNSPNGRLIVFLLVFVVVGGGIMLYKSFAASGSVTALYDKISVNRLPAAVIPETSGSKSGGKVWNVGANGSVKANINMPQISDGAPFQVCAGLKAAQYSNVDLLIQSPTGKGGGGPVNVIAGTDYKQYCVNFSYSSVYTTYNPALMNGSSNDVRVSYISFKYDTKDLCYVSGGTVACSPYVSY